MTATLHIGLVINPLAGLGGSLALKGSDGGILLERLDALDQDHRDRGQERVRRTLSRLSPIIDTIHFSSWGGDMGGALLSEMQLPCNILGSPGSHPSSPEDTQAAVQALCAAGVDLIVFAGGDGTARDIFDVVGDQFPVLGIPSGVKMHSGVFAVSPESAGELLVELASGGLVGLRLQEVRDIDEEAFRQDRVRSRFYGEMQVPGEGRFLQHTKIGGRESEELVAADIAAWLAESLESGRTYLVGPGSTTAALMEELGLPNTLLGVDVIRDGKLLAADADEQQLLRLLDEMPGGATIIVTVIGGQGHIFGRGNQQLSAEVIRRTGVENITVVAAKSKIVALDGRPLLVDTNDPQLDAELSGYRVVITGYDDQIIYRVATGE